MTTRIAVRDAAVLIAILLVGVALLGLAVHAGNVLAIDTTVAPSVMAWYPPGATSLFDTLGSLPVFGAVMLLGVGAALVSGRQAISASFALGLCGEIATTLVKLLVDRPRPPADAGIDAFLTTASYPSGHTVRAILMGGLIAAAFAWEGRSRVARVAAALAGLAFATLVGLARIASGQHWPSDVIGGLLLGGAWLTICLVAADRLELRRGPPRPMVE